MTDARADQGTVRLRPDALDWRDVEGEVVAIDRRTANYLAVNPSGARLWSALSAGASRAELVGILVDAFELERDRAEADVDEFLGELRGLDLLEP
jgi:hypothetical protein